MHLSWWSRVSARRVLPVARPASRPSCVRLRFEDLEHRDAPAVFTVTSALDGLSTVSPTTTPLSQQGDLTLRQAITDANATPGTNTINFAIPTKGGYNLGGNNPDGGAGAPPQVVPLVQTISLVAPLPTLSNPTIIDGTSQAGWQPGAPVIELDSLALGAQNGQQENELAVSANGCVIQGLLFTNSPFFPPANVGLALYSSNNGVYDDTFSGLAFGVNISGGASNNTIGGPVGAQTNNFFENATAIEIQGLGTLNNVVQGNVINYSNFGFAGGSAGILVSGVNNIIGGTALGAGNVIKGVSLGIALNPAQSPIEEQFTTNNVVEGNVISTTLIFGPPQGISVASNGNTIGGTSPGAGNSISGPGASLPLSSDGIALSGTGNSIEGNTISTFNEGVSLTGGNNTIGGTAPGAGNTIGLNNTGIAITGSGNFVQGNLIGMIAPGELAPNTTGVSVSATPGVAFFPPAPATNNLIGGTAAGAGNTIAYNQGIGVDVSENNIPTATGNAIEENSIFANKSGGINPDTAVAPNAPVLQSSSGKNSSHITGTLSEAPNATYTVEFFANPTAPPQGETIQGQIFIGSAPVTTNAAGTAPFTFNAPALEQNVTAIAIDAIGNTSGFSGPPAVITNAVRLGSTSTPASLFVSAPQTVTVGQSLSQPLQATLRDASGNAVAGVKVTFSAPTTGPSATFGGRKTVTAVSDGNGVATAPAFTANTRAGSFVVTVQVSGMNSPADIDLTNVAGPPAKLSIVAGKSRTTRPNAVFRMPVEVRITDSFGNVVSGVTVTFTVQPNAVTGSAGAFQGLPTATAVTDNHGNATAPALQANGKRGSFTVTASIAGLRSAIFDLDIT